MKISQTLEQVTLVKITIPLNIYSYYRENYDIDYEIENKLTKHEVLRLISFFINLEGKYTREMEELYNFIKFETYTDLVQIKGEYMNNQTYQGDITKTYLVYSDQTGRHGSYGSSTTIIGIYLSEKDAVEAVKLYNKEQDEKSRYYSGWKAEYVDVEIDTPLDITITENYE